MVFFGQSNPKSVSHSLLEAINFSTSFNFMLNNILYLSKVE
uniref:Uncharacterized protein n=1 Tax=Rhizophora mucronata TaxID=61149 RepID=A0A2P2P8T2_RHIMU